MSVQDIFWQDYRNCSFKEIHRVTSELAAPNELFFEKWSQKVMIKLLRIICPSVSMSGSFVGAGLNHVYFLPSSDGLRDYGMFNSWVMLPVQSAWETIVKRNYRSSSFKQQLLYLLQILVDSSQWSSFKQELLYLIQILRTVTHTSLYARDSESIDLDKSNVCSPKQIFTDRMFDMEYSHWFGAHGKEVSK